MTIYGLQAARLRSGFALAALLFGATLAGAVSAVEKSAGSPAPDCALTSLGEGPNYDLKQFRGKVVYVDFWASWCTTCVKSFPFMNDLVHEFGDKGLQILGINLDEKPESAKAFLVRHRAHFTIAADRTGTCPRSFEVKAMPATYLIDRQGVVRYRHFGFRAEQASEIRTQLASLLAEPASAQ